MGYFPIFYKNGILILIMKPGKDPKYPINYRSITLLEIPGKIFEHIINRRIHRLYESKSLFNINQYRFRAKLGTELALTKINEEVAINQKYKDGCNTVTRDVTKAFDKVWHNGLRYKLGTTPQIPNLILKILSSYVRDRTAQIKIRNIIGPKFELRSGVPQGGVLSPTLYIIYTADMPLPGNNCVDVAFADDVTQIIQNFNNSKDQLAEDTERD